MSHGAEGYAKHGSVVISSGNEAVERLTSLGEVGFSHLQTQLTDRLIVSVQKELIPFTTQAELPWVEGPVPMPVTSNS